MPQRSDACPQTQWRKFPDGTDNIHIGGFNPENQLRGSHVLFLASFHSNDATLSQLYVCITLLESLVKSLTIVLPFYPVRPSVVSSSALRLLVRASCTITRIVSTHPSPNHQCRQTLTLTLTPYQRRRPHALTRQACSCPV